jgi:type IV pilus assembly protein PilE
MSKFGVRSRGFTLIEVMIAVVIIAVLAGIAYPSYNNHVTKTRRAAAAGCLLENAQLLERYFTTNLTYVGAAVNQCGGNIDAHYQIGFDGAAVARSYAIRAVPLGQQLARDTKCGTLGLTSTGLRSATGSASATPAQCW